MKTTVFLVGFMGCGKSTLGAELASQAGVPFIDLDEYIEREYGMSVQGIFATLGEAAFRQAETAALTAVATTGAVVATGGGTPCHGDNMATMNAGGITVWLTAPVDVITRRLLIPEQRAKRPLLNGLSATEIENFVRQSLEKRRPYYGLAQMHFDSTDIETATATRRTATALLNELKRTTEHQEGR